jgi:predicted ATP-grasp superfamily ATP-dependent carboligase
MHHPDFKAACNAVESLIRNRAVSPEVTREALEELRYIIELQLEALKEQIDSDK